MSNHFYLFRELTLLDRSIIHISISSESIRPTMRFSSFLTIVALLFVQSEATHSTFICTDKSKPEAKVGYCLRRINKDQDHHNKDLPPLYKKDFLVILASPAPKGPKFTCAKLDIANKPVEARFCCHFPPVSPTPPKFQAFTQADIDEFCYTRDAKRKPNHT
ncbi:hypothetical protein MJO28_013291 [Puccinia striiformis f. sp. tritici]|uniref:Uncharacterized protein n=3 Tax=Puccinia striiformis TaxID=27350 RepID=A0A2S4WMH6_9BASI|nr:hypothetical protein Pst134EA_024250 [Puccinia striiformis f. sp. tritici]KAH9444681.1 hypothetical protein Pst134EB_024938 [Puccinia striiformis f. sp. tritici]KAH9453373.1 hypothetical protein Pst134EA_024250 [Puccinia striiformis f. sp. tritici]KAI7941006.1 hypothetical protein MJO28_013291 [Puccinia striiformis f. sp. tritici]POW22934.1 hypothetical protein PSHT_00644 [Puccinia striiformis]